jgi:hypothetical protein
VLYSCGQWVKPIRFLKASSLLLLIPYFSSDLGTIVTVIANLASLYLYYSLNYSLGSHILPPWRVLESKRIMSPAEQVTSFPLNEYGSFARNYNQSLLECFTYGYLSVSSYCTRSLFVEGTTWSPPTPSSLTSTRGTIPCTQ